jgi:Zn-dependent oligopeptidase
MNKLNKLQNNTIKWNMTPEDIKINTENIINKSKKLYDKLEKYELSNENNITKFIDEMSNDLNEFNNYHSLCGFLYYVSPNNKIRNASYSGDLTLTKYINEFNMRINIYTKLIEIKNFNNKNKILCDEDNKFIEKIILNYQRNGINLTENSRNVLLKINHEISKLENSVNRYITNNIENTFIELTHNQLNGVPQNIIDTFVKINNDQFKVQLNKINYNTFMKYIDDDNIRKMVESTYSRSYINILEHMAKLIVLKDKRAKILSYRSHSDFKSHTQMTKNSDNIKNFLTELLHKLNFRYTRELDTIIKIMKKNNKSKLNSWDIQYYITKWKQEYGINENSLKEYFELHHTIDQIFKLYEKIFNIKFIKSNNNNLWHSDIDKYDILQNNNIIGHLCLDMYSRDNKYKQSRCFCLQPATFNQIPFVALLTSFQKENGITLLTFQDVITIFHEMAHVIHHIIGKTKHSIFSGVNVEIDFVETPAQILDSLCFEKNIIKQLSKHYKSGNKLDDNIINKIIKLKNLDIALYYKKHILIALFDQIIYSSQKFIDTCENYLKNSKSNELENLMSNLYLQLHDEIMKSNDDNQKYKINLNKDTVIPYEWVTTFFGSDAQYYCSIWSRVLSSDMYHEKIRGKNIDQSIGNDLIKYILSGGGTKQSYDMICDYMGRKPAIDGFIQMYDLDTEMEYSFFLNTDQINKNEPANKISNQKQNNLQSPNNTKHEQDIDSISNKFSEINESSINIDDFDHQTEDLTYLRDKFKNYRM